MRNCRWDSDQCICSSIDTKHLYVIDELGAAGALMALGDTKSNRNVTIGFFANFALNPLFMFGINLGVPGLALATVVIKIATAFYLLRVLAKRLHIRIRPELDWPH